VRALTEAAPAMAELMRERDPCCKEVMAERDEWIASPQWRAGMPEPPWPTCGKCWACRVNHLLARIDERSKAGG
jgi:hypothetical protein